MIITQTPLRISFLGGGTDLGEYYLREGGCVLSSAIDKYVFVIVKERFDEKIYVNYSRKEIVDSVDELQHELVREAMRLTGVTRGVEITTLADVPSEGIGLGSSSAITVGLLQALYAYEGVIVPAERLASEACRIEIDTLGKPIGKQDQYISAYGNLRFIRFKTDDSVEAERVLLRDEVKQRLDRNLMLFYTNMTRSANTILSEQKANTANSLQLLRELKALAEKGRQGLLDGDCEGLGEMMHAGWELKKRLASGVANDRIDEMYDAARKAGAIGGKITGAGGGGFLLLYCPLGKQDSVRAALHDLRELPFALEWDGTKTIFNVRRNRRP